VAFAVLAVGGLVAATVSQWSRVTEVVAEVNAAEIALAVAGMLAGTFCSMLSWRAILADLGAPLPLKQSVAIYFVGQLGKYLPGSVWPVVAQMELGREYGVQRKTSGVAAMLGIVTGVTSGGLVAAATLPFAAAGELEPYRYAFLVPAVGVVLLVPRVFERVSTVGLRLLRRQPLDQGLSGRGIAVAMAWALLQWAVWGYAVSALADGPSVALCVGAYAFAWVTGLVVLVAPAGAGVREGAFVLLLGTSIGNASALGVALLLRLLSTLSDLFWGLVAFAEGGRAALKRRSMSRDVQV
jgi:hypothetical protein